MTSIVERMFISWAEYELRSHEIKKQLRNEMKDYEIWVGYYDMGQEYSPPEKPYMLDTVQAQTFEDACAVHSLTKCLSCYQDKIKKGTGHKCHLLYDFKTNSHPIMGKYYQSEDEAWTSFPTYKNAPTSTNSESIREWAKNQKRTEN